MDLRGVFCLAGLGLVACGDLTQAQLPGEDGTGTTGGGGTETPVTTTVASLDGTTTDGDEADDTQGTTQGLDDGTTTGFTGATGDTAQDSDTGDSGSTGSSGGSSGSDSDGGGVCGDGLLTEDEVCDDGNVADGDSCSADCSVANCLVPVTHASLQLAEDDVSCEMVWVTPASYAENLVIDRDVAFVTILDGVATIDAQQIGRPVTVTGAVEVSFDSFVMTGGNERVGGGIAVELGALLQLTQTEVTDNFATAVMDVGGVAGGGISVDGAALVLGAGCSVHHNEAAEVDTEEAVALGGGVCALDSDIQIVDGAEVTENLAFADISTGSGNGGQAVAEGGGLFIGQGSLLVSDGVISTNRARAVTTSAKFAPDPDTAFAYGGGVAAALATVAIGGSSIVDNTAAVVATDALAAGGGMWLDDVTLQLTDSLISGNSIAGEELTPSTGILGLGGGLHIEGAGSSAVTDCEISANTALLTGLSLPFAGGGGIALSGAQGASVRVERTVMRDNAASGAGGGAVCLGVGTLDLVNSTISGNSGGQNGGALRAQSTVGSAFNIQLSNVTVASNDAVATGGISLSGNSVTAMFRNSILHGNTSVVAGDCGTSNGATVSSGGYNLIGTTNGCTLSQQASDNIGGDPMLEALADNGGPTLTHALPSGSPAVDMGNPANCLDAQGQLVTLDQRSEDRYGVAGICDVGAFELVP